MRLSTGLVAAAGLISSCATATAPPAARRTSSYQDLAALFAEWRAFQRPKLVDGVPDYGAAAMEAQHRELPAWQRRLDAFDAGAWPVAQQVDLEIVRAEMNGLDFDHRVLKPWSRNPAFYVSVFDEQSDQPAREGPFAHGSVELWMHRFPLAPEKAAE